MQLGTTLSHKHHRMPSWTGPAQSPKHPHHWLKNPVHSSSPQAPTCRPNRSTSKYIVCSRKDASCVLLESWKLSLKGKMAYQFSNTQSGQANSDWLALVSHNFSMPLTMVGIVLYPSRRIDVNESMSLRSWLVDSSEPPLEHETRFVNRSVSLPDPFAAPFLLSTYYF